MRIRPRFRLTTKTDIEKIKSGIEQQLNSHPELCTGEIVKDHIILKIPRQQQHYWSPQLTLQLEREADETLIRGLYAPKPGVWTMFVFFYSAIGFFTTMGLIFGLSQMMLKMDPWGLWIVPAGIFLLVALFVISKIGQGLSKEQMHQLKHFMENSLDSNEKD